MKASNSRRFSWRKCGFRNDLTRGIGCAFLLWLLCAQRGAWAETEAATTNAPSPRRIEIQFEQSARYASEPEMMRHLGYGRAVPLPDLGQEKFRVVIPASYSTNSEWGLLVWVSPGDDPRIPESWEPELAAQQLLFVAACHAGNERHAIQRCRLALDAVCNMCRRYRIDPKRIYIGGFSGGGRIASIMGVAYADLFTGTLAICGVDFYQNVPAERGQFYPATYKPDANVLLRAKAQGRYVLMTGEHDANRLNTQRTAEHGFTRGGFRHVLYLEVAGMDHTLPAAGPLRTALAFLRR